MDDMREVQIGSDLIYEGKILDFYRDTVRLPNGHSATRELVRHNGAVAIVPLLDDGRVIVEDQYRYPHDGVIVEIPAGKLDGSDEDPEEAARRELQEETDLTVGEESLKLIGVYSAPGRDPRGRTVTAAYRIDISDDVKAAAGDDAAEVRWWPLEALPPLAFDHDDIITAAKRV